MRAIILITSFLCARSQLFELIGEEYMYGRIPDSSGLFPLHISELNLKTWENRVLTPSGLEVVLDTFTAKYKSVCSDITPGSNLEKITQVAEQKARVEQADYFSKKIDLNLKTTYCLYVVNEVFQTHVFLDAENMGIIVTPMLGTEDSPLANIPLIFNPVSFLLEDLTNYREEESVSVYPDYVELVAKKKSMAEGPAVINNVVYFTTPFEPGIHKLHVADQTNQTIHTGGKSYISLLASRDEQYMYALRMSSSTQNAGIEMFDIETETFTELWTHPDKSAFLNDLTHFKDSLLVTDFADNKIYKYDFQNVTTIWSGELTGPNGIFVRDTTVYVQMFHSSELMIFNFDGNNLYNKRIKKIHTGSGDGICVFDDLMLLTVVHPDYDIIAYDLISEEVFHFIKIFPDSMITNCARASAYDAYITSRSGEVVRYNVNGFRNFAKLNMPESSPEDLNMKILAWGAEFPRNMIVNEKNDIIYVEQRGKIVYVETGNYMSDTYRIKTRQDFHVLFDGGYCDMSFAEARNITCENPNALNLNHGIVTRDGYLFASSSSTVFVWEFDGSSRTLGTERMVVNNIERNAFVSDGDLEPRQNNHRTRELIFDKEGNLFIQVGSYSDVDSDDGRSLIRKISKKYLDQVLREKTVIDWLSLPIFALGVRNTVGMSLDSKGSLWGVNMGADALIMNGYTRETTVSPLTDENPLDTLYRFDEFNNDKKYGYPYCMLSGQTLIDPNGVKYPPNTLLQWDGRENPDIRYTNSECQNTSNIVPPVLGLGPHVAPINIAFNMADVNNSTMLSYDGKCDHTLKKKRMFEKNFAAVTFKGSWARVTPIGYKIVQIPFEYKNWEFSPNGKCMMLKKQCPVNKQLAKSYKCCPKYSDHGIWVPSGLREERSKGDQIDGYSGNAPIEDLFANSQWLNGRRDERYRPTGLVFGMNGELFASSGTPLHGQIIALYKS